MNIKNTAVHAAAELPLISGSRPQWPQPASTVRLPVIFYYYCCSTTACDFKGPMKTKYGIVQFESASCNSLSSIPEYEKHFSTYKKKKARNIAKLSNFVLQ